MICYVIYSSQNECRLIAVEKLFCSLLCSIFYKTKSYEAITIKSMKLTPIFIIELAMHENRSNV